jgi:UDP-N-acetylglucosamine acyltransferase
MNQIHPTALIDPSAQLGEGVVIGPYVIIEQDVTIGAESRIGAHSVIKQHTRIGRGNHIHEHVVIGGDPQDISFQPCVTHVIIGDENQIREGVTIHRATQENQATRIGDGNFLMAYCHIAHDCVVGNRAILANGATLAGHVSVGDRAFLSGNVVIHQFCRIGRLVMLSGLAAVGMDCLPFVLAAGNPARVRGLNRVGLKRAGFSQAEVQELNHALHILFRPGKRLVETLEELSGMGSPLTSEWVSFIQSSKRGFIRNQA